MADIFLEAAVKTVVTDLITRSVPFTALDVSNEVKKNSPAVRHRDVSPIVRELYRSGDMGLYERTQIDVETASGPEKAYLYHPVEDTWDLDAKYDNAKRAQSATIPRTPIIGVATDTPGVFSAPMPPPPADIAEREKFLTPPRAEVASALAETKDVPITAHAPLPPEVKDAMAEVKTMRAQQKKDAEALPPSIWSTLFSFGRKKK